MNNHIIPQLIRFASAFSVVTDNNMREDSIKRYKKKVIDYLFRSKQDKDKVFGWIKEIDENIDSDLALLKFNELLDDALRTNVKIMLIIDELSYEQKDTIKNIIGSFKLDSDKRIQFLGYAVRLEQRISSTGKNSEFALSLQK